MKTIILYNDISKGNLEKRESKFDVIILKRTQLEANDTPIRKLLKEVEGIIGSKLIINRDFLVYTPKLKIVSNISVGYDNCNIKDFNRFNVMLTNTPNVLNASVVEIIIGMMLSIGRKIHEMDNYVKENRWTSGALDKAYFGMNIHNKTLGILGLGRIGYDLSKVCKYGFNMNILYHNRNRNKKAETDFDAEYVSMQDLFKQSDYLIVLIPYTNKNHHIVNYKLLSKMKSNAIIVGASRGGIIKEKDLVKVLEENLVAGAGLD